MNRLIPITALAVALLTALPASAQPDEVSPLEISSLDDRPSRVGPDELFTGTAIIDMLFNPNDTRRASGAFVTFAPGTRTAWHSHPAGQTLVVTEGIGWVQTRDGERREIRAGDVVWTPPGVEHWHGGTTEHAMVHIALQEAVDGQVVTWLELVTDAEYLGTNE